MRRCRSVKHAGSREAAAVDWHGAGADRRQLGPARWCTGIVDSGGLMALAASRYAITAAAACSPAVRLSSTLTFADRVGRQRFAVCSSAQLTTRLANCHNFLAGAAGIGDPSRVAGWLSINFVLGVVLAAGYRCCLIRVVVTADAAVSSREA